MHFQQLNVEFSNTRLVMVGYEEPLLDPLSKCSKNIGKKRKYDKLMVSE